MKPRSGLIFCAVVILAVAIRVYGINAPWLGGHHAWNGALFSQIARNYERFDLVDTKLAPVINLGPNHPERFKYSLYHPFLLPILVSVSFKIFGVHEWSATLVPILFSLGTLIVIFLIARRLWGESVALLATFFLAMIPMDAYYGRVVVHEVPALFFAMLTLLFYLSWIEQQKKRYYVGIFVSYVLGMLSGWPAYYIGPLIALHYLIFEHRRIRRLSFFFMLPLTALITFALQIAYIAYLKGSVLWLFQHALWRASPSGEWAFTAQQWLARLYARIQLLFTPVLFVLALVWGGSALLDAKRKEVERHSIVFLLLLYGLAHAIVFRQDSWIHEYLIFYLSPFFAISAAVAVHFLNERVLRSKLFLTIPFGLAIIGLVLTQAYPRLDRLHHTGDGDHGLIELMLQVQTRLAPSDKFISSMGLAHALNFYVDRPYTVATKLHDFLTHVHGDSGYKIYLFAREGKRLRTLHGLRAPVVDRDLKDYLLTHYNATALSENFVVFDLHTPPGLSIDPKVESIVNTPDLAAYREAARSHLRSQEFAKALQLYESLLPHLLADRLGSEDILLMSTAYKRLGLVRQAEEVIQSHLTVDPNNLTLLTLLTALHAKAGRIEELAEIHQRIVPLIPHKMSIWFEDRIEFLGYDATVFEDGSSEIALYFKCLRPLTQDYAVWIHGYPKMLDQLDKDRKLDSFNNYDADPWEPTSQWQPGAIYKIVSRRIIKAGDYRLIFGYWSPKTGHRLPLRDDPKIHQVDLGWMALGNPRDR